MASWKHSVIRGLRRFRIVSIMLAAGGVRAAVQSYTVEAINDPFFLEYPNPRPRHVVTRSFMVHGTPGRFEVPITSLHLHNISVRIENLCEHTIHDPYLRLDSEWGCDFRTIETMAAQIVEGAANPREKFLRLFQWLAYHYDRFGTSGADEYSWEEFMGNPLRLIDQYGGGMCGESVETLCALLYAAPPSGTLRGHKVQLDGHQTGEVFLNGAWRAFDSNPSTRWVYDLGDHIPPASFRRLRDNGGQMIRRTLPLTGWDIRWAVRNAPCTAFPEGRPRKTRLPFRFDLKPAESLTMYFDMRGRVERKSRGYDHAGFNRQSPAHRNPCDYGSAVFDYRPDFSKTVHKQFAGAMENVRWTRDGLVPADPRRAASIVFRVRSAWLIVGARIEADFTTTGTVSIARNRDVMNLYFPPDGPWTPLDSGRMEYGAAGIEGAMAYWVRFEFKGPGSGLRRARIATEVQMSPYTMPGLRYGENRFVFTAENMAGRRARITFTYDDRAPYDTYEPATEDYGAYLHYRVGGDRSRTWCKNLFYKNIKRDPKGGLPITVELYKAFGRDFGRKVRTLKSGRIPFGDYWWYWNGRDDAGRRLPPGPYAFKITGDVGEGPWGRGTVWGECLILFDRLWPRPNEIRWKK